MICLQNNYYNFVSHIGFVSLFISYFIREPFYLRICLAISSFIFIIWGILALPIDACLSASIWNFLFLLINIYNAIIEYKSKNSTINM